MAAAAPIGSLLGPNIDWCENRTGDSQGIRQIRHEPGRGMILECRLSAEDATSKHGECFVDLKYVPSLEGLVPLDLTGHTITVEVEIGGGLDAPKDSPNGVQVFVRDKGFRAQYGVWRNWTEAGTVTASLKPSRDGATAGHTDKQFNPAACRVIGVKIGTGAKFEGQQEAPLVVTRLDVDPPLPSSPPPPLPADYPLPHLTAESRVVPKPDGFYVDGRKTYLVGGNWRVIEYGQNFGATAWFPEGDGVSKHPGYVAARLDCFRRAGILLVRVGLLDDGRAVLDRKGAVTGFSQTFHDDVAMFLDLAAQHNVKVEFVLIDFHAAGRGEEVGGVWLRGRGMVLEDPQIRARFIDEFVEPFLETFGRHRALFGIDVINEPEWIVSEAHGGAWEAVEDAVKAGKPISGDQLREFINQCADCVHRLAPDKLVTVGVSCVHLGLVSDLDALDYLAPHYYPWMNSLDRNLAAIPKGKPYLLEEYPGKGDVWEYLAKVQAAGGAGSLLWNLSPEIDDQSPSFAAWGEMLLATRKYVDELE
ncbi:MAG: hypothetical protein ABIK89_03145 [Planctomycetota bacterium]